MKSLFLIRHGKAAGREHYRHDADRPLTADGSAEVAACGRALARMVRLDVMLSSPLVRARQTAALFAAAYDPAPPIHLLNELAPVEDVDALLILAAHQRGHAIALVGHEPDMSMLTSYLLTGRANVQVDFAKAMVCQIDFEGRELAGGAGILRCLIPAPVLRAAGAK